MIFELMTNDIIDNNDIIRTAFHELSESSLS